GVLRLSGLGALLGDEAEVSGNGHGTPAHDGAAGAGVEADRSTVEPSRGAAVPEADTETTSGAGGEAPASPPAAPTTLGIPDYDSLSASQVVPRLEGLSPEELQAVREYESATRGRKTILNKIVQLQAP